MKINAMDIRVQRFSWRTCMAALLWMFAQSCSVQPPEGPLICGSDSDCPSGWVCRDNGAKKLRCFRSAPMQGMLDASMGTPIDSGGRQGRDAGAESGVATTEEGMHNPKDAGAESGVPCHPESEADLCVHAHAQCGRLQATDNCGFVRSVDCGSSCAIGGHCDANRCSCDLPSSGGGCCIPQTDAELCSERCGVFSTTDNCGSARTLQCGDPCVSPAVCDAHSNRCKCTPETDQELCSAHAECGPLSLQDRCNNMRALNCGACGAGTCLDSANVCQCYGGMYLGDGTTELDSMNRYDPSTDTLLNDIPFVDDNGTIRSCTQNTSAAMQSQCVSIRGWQSHIVGTTPTGSTLFVLRASSTTCGVSQAWIFEGTLSPYSYAGVDITAAVSGNGLLKFEDGHLAMAPDGLTIVGRSTSSNGTAFAELRRSAIGQTDFGSLDSTPYAQINALGTVGGPAFSANGKLLFFTKGSEIWQAERLASGSGYTYGNPVKLPGTNTNEINDGTFWGITGATDSGLTLLVMKNYGTHVFTRTSLTATATLQNTSPWGAWYAHLISGCGKIIGTMSPGGCGNEGIGILSNQ